MPYLTFSWWDYLIVFIIVGFSISIGAYYGFFKKTDASSTEDIYLVKEMKVLPIAMSMVASTISIPDILSLPAEIYVHGTQFWVEIFCLPVAGLIVALMYLPTLYKLKLCNCYQYLDKRFNSIVGKLCFASFIIPGLLLVQMFIYAPSLVLNQVSGYNTHVVAIFVSSICIFYTTFGGLKAVIWADTLQLTVTLLSFSIALIIGIVSAGGLGNVWKKAEAGDRLHFFELNPDPTVRTTFWNVIIGHIGRWTAFIIIHPASTQRFLSASNIADSKRVILLFVLGMMITKTILCFSGLIIYSKYSDCDPLSVGDIKAIDQIVPFYVLDVASTIPGLGTMFIAGLIAIAMSVLSTALNVLACSLYADFVSLLLPSSVKRQWGVSIMRTITVCIGLLGIGFTFVAEKLGSLFEMSYFVIGSSSGAVLGVFTMGAIFPLANIKGALSGGLVSMVFMLFLTVKTQIYIWKGAIRYESKSLSVETCNKTTLNTTSSMYVLLQPVNSLEEPLWLFRISFHYHVCMGCVICVIVGLAVSWFTRNEDDVDPDLLSPVIKKLIYKTTVPVNRYESLTVVSEKPFETLNKRDETTLAAIEFNAL